MRKVTIKSLKTDENQKEALFGLFQGYTLRKTCVLRRDVYKAGALLRYFFIRNHLQKSAVFHLPKYVLNHKTNGHLY